MPNPFSKKNAAATLEYVVLILIVLGVAILSRDYVSRAIFGKWKTSMDSLSSGRQYDPAKTMECLYDPPTGIWYDVKCAEAIICAPTDTACLFDRVNQCSPKCIDNEHPPICSRRTQCMPGECGDVDDNCKGILPCGNCPNSGDHCNLTTHKCECAPKTTCSPGDCGDVPNGCGTGTVPCPSCPVGTCINNHCCIPRTTCNPGDCGDVPNGCGTGTIPCGSCPVGVCINNQCCTPRTTCNPGECGDVDAGCGKRLDCGDPCTPLGQRCNTTTHQCECIPRTTCNPGECGDVSDGCLGTLHCGTCPAGICISNQCCVSRTMCRVGECEDVDVECGETLHCPKCPSLQRCIIDAFDNHKCCTPLTCTPGRCGKSGDNCQGTLDCGNPCTPVVQACFNNQCCTLESDAVFCSRLGIQCGKVSGTDNCGQPRTVAECGPCPPFPPGQVCSIPKQQCCLPESDSTFCSGKGIQCGEAGGIDNCGQLRVIAECGPCPFPTQECSSTQQCCFFESDATFCSRLNIQCGEATGTDNCGLPKTVTECGPCPFPTQECSSTQQCCFFESDATFCSRKGIQCGEATGTDNCGLPRTVAECGSCPPGKPICENGQCRADTSG